MSEIDYSNKDFLRHPHPLLAQSATAESLQQVKLPKIGRATLITGSDALIDFLKSPHRFTTNPDEVGKPNISSHAGYLPNLPTQSGNVLFQNGKDHRELKNKLDLALKQSGIKSIRPNVAKIADQLLENSVAIDKRNKNTRDIVTQFSQLLPILVMIELIGFPKTNAEEVLKWVLQITYPQGLLSAHKQRSAYKNLLELLTQIMGGSVETPTESLAAKLIAIDASSPIDNAHLAFFTLMASLASTSDLISLGCLTLIDHPQQLEQLQQDWTKASSAVEEVLRYAAPTQTTSARYALSNFEFHGHSFKKGDLAFGFLAASNMDPNTNESPLDFNISRTPIRQMSFGAGAHFCSGAQLAHIIAEVALQRLFSTWPNLQLANNTNGKDPIDWTIRFGARRPSKMLVQY